MTLTLAEVRRNVPSIHVFTSEGEFQGVTMLMLQDHDARHDNRPYSEGCTAGNGSRDNPYTYKAGAPISPHYAVVDLWLRFRTNHMVFIKVKDWLLELHQDGVVAEDGHFTKLLPTD